MTKNIITEIIKKGRKALFATGLITALGLGLGFAANKTLNDKTATKLEADSSELVKTSEVIAEEFDHCPEPTAPSAPLTAQIITADRFDLVYSSEYDGYLISQFYTTESTNAQYARNYNIQIPSTYDGKTLVGFTSNVRTAVYDTWSGWHDGPEMEALHVQRLILPSTFKYIANDAFVATGTASVISGSSNGDDTADWNETVYDLSRCSNLEYIGDNAFLNHLVCKLPDQFTNLKHIGSKAFENSFSTIYEENKGVKLPAIEEIGSRAFYGNTNLKAIQLGSVTKTIGDSAFEECRHIEYS